MTSSSRGRARRRGADRRSMSPSSTSPCSLVERDGRIFGDFVYNDDLFEHATIERFAAHFCVLLEAAVREPERPCHALPMLALDESGASSRAGTRPRTASIPARRPRARRRQVRAHPRRDRRRRRRASALLPRARRRTDARRRMARRTAASARAARRSLRRPLRGHGRRGPRRPARRRRLRAARSQASRATARAFVRTDAGAAPRARPTPSSRDGARLDGRRRAPTSTPPRARLRPLHLGLHRPTQGRLVAHRALVNLVALDAARSRPAPDDVMLAAHHPLLRRRRPEIYLPAHHRRHARRREPRSHPRPALLAALLDATAPPSCRPRPSPGACSRAPAGGPAPTSRSAPGGARPCRASSPPSSSSAAPRC